MAANFGPGSPILAQDQILHDTRRDISVIRWRPGSDTRLFLCDGIMTAISSPWKAVQTGSLVLNANTTNTASFLSIARTTLSLHYYYFFNFNIIFYRNKDKQNKTKVKA